MALTFGGASSDRVNIGTVAVLDNLDPYTVIAWVNPTNTTQATRIYQKGLSTNANLFRINNGTVEITRTRAITDCSAIATVGNLAAVGSNKWVFLAGQIDSSTAANNKLYAGDLTTIVAAAAAYSTQTVGSGTLANNAGSAAVVGNNNNNNVAFVGQIALIGVWNRLLSLGELKVQQFHPRMTSGCLYFCHLGYNGIGTQPDWSGNANTGTVTGATQSAHVPLGPFFGDTQRNPYIVAAVTQINQYSMLLGCGS